MTISDSGVPSLSSVTRVVIRVGDVNDEEPRFLDRQHRVRIPRLPVGMLDLGLYRVVADDRDIGLNADLDYSIAPPAKESRTAGAEAKFRIHQKTGMIYALSELEKEAQYDLQVRNHLLNIISYVCNFSFLLRRINALRSTVCCLMFFI